MAVFDVSRAYVRELEGLGYSRLSTDQLVAMRIHEVTPAFIRELQKQGYRHLSVDDLVYYRIFAGSLPASARRR